MDAGTESVLAEYGLLGRGDLDGLRKSRKERGTSGVGSTTNKGTDDTKTTNTNGQNGTNTEGTGGNNTNKNRTQSDRPFINNREGFTLEEQSQIYDLKNL